MVALAAATGRCAHSLQKHPHAHVIPHKLPEKLQHIDTKGFVARKDTNHAIVVVSCDASNIPKHCLKLSVGAVNAGKLR